jgi:dTDP-4-amino-4,6-dideoxygalactose transaminase
MHGACQQFLQNDFQISEKASKEVVSVRMNSFLTHEQISYIISHIKKIYS